jgi:hypothetical protein
MTVPRIAMLMVLGAWAGCMDSSDGGVKSVSSPASQLLIEPTIDDSDPAPADGMVPVEVKFFQANEYVRLSSATLSVNEITVPYSPSGYNTRIPGVLPGSAITFKLVQSGKSTQFDYQIPQRPVITMPMANEVVPRTANVMITYEAAGGHAVRPIAANGSFTTPGSEQSDNGVAFIDATMLPPGGGSVRVTRRYVITPSGTGFQGVTITYTNTSAATPVTWQ